MKIKSSISCLVLIALLGCSILASAEAVRVKRQAQQDARPNFQRNAIPAAEIGANAASVSSSSATSIASSFNSDAALPKADSNVSAGSSRANGQARPVRPNVRPPMNAPVDENIAFDQDDEGLDVAPRPSRRKRPHTRQRVRPDRYKNDHDDEEDCDDDYNDYGNMFHAAFRPMRQMGNMMGNMFEHMQSLASGDYENLPADGNYAVATARNDGTGYSRQSSIVNNNGKRRGFVSETRNGRTQTRRIDDDNEE